MSLLTLPVHERVRCLTELLSCSGRMYSWAYDPEGKLLGTDCPDRVLDKVFRAGGYMEAVLAHASENRAPIMFSSPYGLSWCAALEFKEDVLARIYVFGPVTSMEMSYNELREVLRSAQIPSRFRTKLIKVLQNVPAVSTISFFRYTLMLHYCVTGERLTNADIVFLAPEETGPADDSAPKRDRLKTYQAEQALMRMVTEGDLNYKEILHDASAVSQGVRADRIGSLTQVKLSIVVFTSLCTRAAIRGGISPETAYSRGDAYIQEVMDCRTLSDAARIAHDMYDDFIRLVHRSRMNPLYSDKVRSTCEYIELHVEEKLKLSDIAKRLGYTDYYLSRRFREETGTSIGRYIKQRKIERAKTLLAGTDLSIQEIADRLGFGSRSFFAETFREITGLPPAAYRNRSRCL